MTLRLCLLECDLSGEPEAHTIHLLVRGDGANMVVRDLPAQGVPQLLLDALGAKRVRTRIISPR